MIDLSYIPKIGDFHPTIAPYAFTGPYAGCREMPEVAMDDRHIFIMHDILKAWPFKSALEIGSFNGASSTAFIEAINSGEGLGKSGIVTFCDVCVSESLVSVVGNCCLPERVRITRQPSWAVLDSKLDFDFIFVDGAHDLDSVTLEMKRLMRRRPLCMMAHDTSATEAGYSQCEGAAMLMQTFVDEPSYLCLEDCETREGERTNRGLFFASTDRKLYLDAASIFKKWK